MLSITQWTKRVQWMVFTRERVSKSASAYREPCTDWAETNKRTLLQGLLRQLSDALREESPCLPQTSVASQAPALNPDCVVWSLLLNFPDHQSFHLLWCKGTMASCSSDLKSLTCKHLCGDRTPSLSSSRTLTETLSPPPTNSLKALSQLLQSHFPQMLYVICSIFQWINGNLIHPLWEREPGLKDPLIMNDIYKGLAPGLPISSHISQFVLNTDILNFFFSQNNTHSAIISRTHHWNNSSLKPEECDASTLLDLGSKRGQIFLSSGVLPDPAGLAAGEACSLRH